MRIWVAATSDERCGMCWGETKKGEPVQVIQLPGVTKDRRRCVSCAVGEVDWSQVDAYKARLEAVEAEHAAHAPIRLVSSKPARGFTKLGDAGKPFDPKLAAAGDDK